MDHILKPCTNEMWATLEGELSSESSSCSTCSMSPSPPEAEPEAEIDSKTEPTESSFSIEQRQPSSSRSPRRVELEGPAVPPTPITSKSYLEIDSQHLGPLETLATVATCSPDSLHRLTSRSQNQIQEAMDDKNNRESSLVEEEDDDDDDDEMMEENEEDFESLELSHSPHHSRSPRSYVIHQAQQDAKKQPLPKGQREAMPRTSRATHQNNHREVVSPTRTLRRRPSVSYASSPPQSRPRAISQSSLFQAQAQAQSQSRPISGPSGSKLPSNDHQDIIIRYPQAKGTRRPALDISSERLLTSLRGQLKDSLFSQYTMPHPKRDGTASGKKWRCTYDLEDGGRCNVACSRKGEARRHAFTHEIHLRWICPSLASNASSCGKLFARQDAAVRHVEQSRTCKDLAAHRTEGFPVLVWEEEDEIVAKIVTLSWNEDDNEGED